MHILTVSEETATLNHDGVVIEMRVSDWQHPELVPGLPEHGVDPLALISPPQSVNGDVVTFHVALNHEPLTQKFFFQYAVQGDRLEKGVALATIRAEVERLGLDWRLDEDGNVPPPIIFAWTPPLPKEEQPPETEDEALVARVTAQVIQMMRAGAGTDG